jgi:hypothetical protein
MNYIEKRKQLETLLKSGKTAKLIFPVWSSQKAHEYGNRLSFIYYRMDDEAGIINCNHIDGCKIDMPQTITAITDSETFVYGIRYLQDMLPNGVDFEWAWLENYGTPFSFEEQFSALYNGYRSDYKTLHDCIPIMKWFEKLEKLPDMPQSPDSYKKYTQGIITLGSIEKNAIQVDFERFTKEYDFPADYIYKNRVYTKYNPYTTTGRPTNRHLNVNWSAIPKVGGKRQTVISRYEPMNGTLIQFDWESYHLRLIGRMVGYEFPENISAHSHLSEWYGDIDYESAKALTFRYLYGGLDDVGKSIPFFQSVNTYISELYRKFIIDGKLTTPIFGREIGFQRISEPSEQKVFNYLLQSIETEINYKKLNEILKVMHGKMSKLILYTYDAILIDTHPSERDSVISEIQKVMIRGGFPVRTYEGKNYGNLVFLF